MRFSKKARYVLSAAAGILLMAATVPLAIWITHSTGAELGNARARCERFGGSVHKAVILNGAVSPGSTQAEKCDTLIITNLDDRQRLVAFGRHDSHISYNGVSEKLLSRGQSLTVRLVTPGSFIFHDHLQPGANGSFTVR